VNLRRSAALALAVIAMGAAGLAPHGGQAAAPPNVKPGPAPDPASISVKVLPEGKDRNLVVRTCAVCHPIELVVAMRRTDADWERQLSRMMDFGAIASEPEQDRILDYLEQYFSTERPAH